MDNKWPIIGGTLLGLLVVSFAWSAALTFLLTHSIKALNTMQPWGVYQFMWTYGVAGRAGTLLWHSLVIAVVCTGLASLPFFLLRRPNWYGDARWAREGEIAKAKLRANWGLILGKKGKYLVNDEPVHALVAAPTRSGKGVGIVIPNLLYWNGSAIVLDIKHENYALTAGYRDQYQDVHMWAPMDAHSARFNPLDFIAQEGPRRVSDIQKLATILLPHSGRGDTMWVNESRDLFLGLVLLVLDDQAVPSTIGQVYRTLKDETDLVKIIEQALERPDIEQTCRESLANFKTKAEKERSGVKSNLTQALNLWANPHIDAATAASDFDLRAFRRKRATVYVGVAQDQLLTLAPLLNLFFQQAVAVLSQALPGKDETHEVLFLIDEFAMLGEMPTIATGLALLAGYHIRIVLIVQGLGQLEEIYGKGGTEGLLQNCALQIFFASNDDSTTHYVSNRLGTKTVQVKSTSQSQDWKTTTSTSYVPRPMLPPEEVRRLHPHRAIIFKETARPVLARKVRYYAERFFKNRLLDTPAVKEMPLAGGGKTAVITAAQKAGAGTTSRPEMAALVGEFADQPQE